MFERDQNYIMHTYRRLPLSIREGKGVFLYDENHTAYLDMYAGIGVNSVGHHHPKVMKALNTQAKKFFHLSNYFVTESVSNLAQLLVQHSFAERVFFANSGTEANEAAIKLARKYGKLHAADKVEIITLSDAFHGRTIGGLSLTVQAKYQKDFTPLMPQVITVLKNDIESLEGSVSDKTCAIFLEMIQGESGIVPISESFLKKVSELAAKHQFLIVVDEVQTGIFRTGRLFAYQHTTLLPDILTTAKALGGGLPLGAMLVSEKLKDIFKPGDHGSTFGGNPLAAASGKAALEVLLDEKFQKSFQNNIKYLETKVKILQKNFPHIITEVRGKGMMYGLEVSSYAERIKQKALDKHLLLNVTNQTVIRLLPPLIIRKKEIDLFYGIMKEILETL